MNWNNLKLSYKLFIGFGIVILLSLFIGYFAYQGFKTVQHGVQIADGISQVESNVLQSRWFLSRFVYSKKEDDINQGIAHSKKVLELADKIKAMIQDKTKHGIPEAMIRIMTSYIQNLQSYANIDKNKSSAYKTITEADVSSLDMNNPAMVNLRITYLEARIKEKEYVNIPAKTNFDEWKSKIEAAITASQSLSTENLTSQLTSYKNQFESYNNYLGQQLIFVMKLKEEGVEAMQVIDTGRQEIFKYLDNGIAKAANYIAILSIVITVISILLTINITRSINKGIKQSITIAEEVANGNLVVNINTNYLNRKDEVGILSNTMNNMIQKLKKTAVDIINGADFIASASMQITSTSQHLSQGANEQASSTEEVASSMEEMLANIENNTDNSIKTEKIALQSVGEINDSNKLSENAAKHVDEITNKISIIGEIARQTNILALNAAVEAARAGEHGKGFAVVAVEVRKLAERAQVAAIEIEKLSKDGKLASDTASNKLEGVVEDIQKTAKYIQEITAANMEQKNGAHQVNNALQALNLVTQQNVAASEELATSAEELMSQADYLKQIISFFKIDDSSLQTLKHNRKIHSTLKLHATQAKNKKNITKKPVNVVATKGNGNGKGVVIDMEDTNNKEVLSGALKTSFGDNDFEKF